MVNDIESSRLQDNMLSCETQVNLVLEELDKQKKQFHAQIRELQKYETKRVIKEKRLLASDILDNLEVWLPKRLFRDVEILYLEKYNLEKYNCDEENKED